MRTLRRVGPEHGTLKGALLKETPDKQGTEPCALGLQAGAPSPLPFPVCTPLGKPKGQLRSWEAGCWVGALAPEAVTRVAGWVEAQKGPGPLRALKVAGTTRLIPGRAEWAVGGNIRLRCVRQLRGKERREPRVHEDATAGEGLPEERMPEPRHLCRQ